MEDNDISPSWPTPQHNRAIGQKPDEPGRAWKYTEARCQEVIALAAEGKFPEEWCAAMGVTFATIWRWKRDKPEFRAACEAGRVILEAYWAQTIRNAATDPTAKVRTDLLLEVLRKRFPHLWGREGQVDQLEPPPGLELDDEGDKPIDMVDLPKITDERLQERIQQLLQRRDRSGKVVEK